VRPAWADNVINDELVDACRLANKAAWAVTGERACSVIASCALNEWLWHRGYRPLVARVELYVSARHRWHGTLDSDSTSSWWPGTVGVVVGDYLLLPAADQGNAEHGLRLAPLCLPLPEKWGEAYPAPCPAATFPAEREARTATLKADASTTVCAHRYFRQQIGVLAAGDTRPSKWRPVYERMIALEAASE
jgi:hypothetical protein